MGWGGSLAAKPSFSSHGFGVLGSLTFQEPASSRLCPDSLQAGWNTEFKSTINAEVAEGEAVKSLSY